MEHMRCLFYVYSKGKKRGKHGTKERGNIFPTKEENEKISSNLFLQALVLVVTEIQIQLYKY